LTAHILQSARFLWFCRVPCFCLSGVMWSFKVGD
jgi:hypothetical protein